MRSARTRVDRSLRRVAGGRHVWLALLALGSADVALTLVGLGAGLSERNPVAVRALDAFGAAGLVGLKAVAFALLAVVTAHLSGRYRGAVFVGFGLTQLVAVGWNAMVVGSRLTLTPYLPG